jgi:hypothetical protein
MEAPLECTLRTLRQFAGASLDEIARAADLSWNHLRLFEQGSIRLRPAQLIAVARAVREAVEQKVTRYREAREKARALGLARARKTRNRLRKRARLESFRTRQVAQRAAWRRKKAMQAQKRRDRAAVDGVGCEIVAVPMEPSRSSERFPSPIGELEDVRLLSPEALAGWHHQSLLERGSRHCHGINYTH